MESLSKNLFILRKRKGLSREAVARALEMSAMTYQLAGRAPLPETTDEGA